MKNLSKVHLIDEIKAFRKKLLDEKAFLFKERDLKMEEARWAGRVKTPRGIYELTGQLSEVDRFLRELDKIFNQCGIK